MAPAKNATTLAPIEPADDAEADPQTAASDAARGGEHDADDEAGLDDLAEDDDEGAEHPAYSATTAPWAVASLNSPKKG